MDSMSPAESVGQHKAQLDIGSTSSSKLQDNALAQAQTKKRGAVLEARAVCAFVSLYVLSFINFHGCFFGDGHELSLHGVFKSRCPTKSL